MTSMTRLRTSQGMIVRLIADALVINLAVVVALSIRFFYLIQFEHAISGEVPKHIFWTCANAYFKTALPLTLISLVAFYLSGFYTYGRAYRGRYKALIIAQAASLAYLVFGFLAYFIAGSILLPRSVLLMAWIFSVGLLCVARLSATLWANVVRAERYLFKRAQDRRVRNVLVIGGAGYIGSALLPKLLMSGYHVRVLDLLLYGIDPIEEWTHHRNLELMQADFRQVDRLVEAMQDIDAVIHLGGIVGDPACSLDEELTIEINLMATRMIAEVAKGSGVRRFVFASTCSVYGASDEILDERSELSPVSLYARSKIASEKILMEMTSRTFSPTILRFGTIYGLSGRTRFDLVVNLLTAKAVVERKITVFGGDQWRPFLHVDDGALAVLKVLEAPLSQVDGNVFNIGSDVQNYTIAQVGEIIRNMVPAAELHNLGSDTDRRNYRVTFGKIRKTLDFRPQWTLEQGIQQVIDAVESGKVRDYRDPKYSNVKFLSEQGATNLTCLLDNWAYDMIEETSSELRIPVELRWDTRIAIHKSDNIHQLWFLIINAAEEISLRALSLEFQPRTFGVCSLQDFAWNDGLQTEKKHGGENTYLVVQLPLFTNGNFYGSLRLGKPLGSGHHDHLNLRRIEHFRRSISKGLERLARKARTRPDVLQDRRQGSYDPNGDPVVVHRADVARWSGVERRRSWQQDSADTLAQEKEIASQ